MTTTSTTNTIAHPTKLAGRAQWLRANGDRAGAERLEADLVRAGRCRRCGRALTDPESIAAGVGPDCRSKAKP